MVNIELVVVERKGALVVNSRDVAAYFKKRQRYIPLNIHKPLKNKVDPAHLLPAPEVVQ